LVWPISGSLTLTKTAAQAVAAKGVIQTVIKLECHRCLRPFDHQVNVSIKQVYATKPVDDEQAIVKDEISLDEVIQQEIVLSLPIKILDRPDCPGLDWSN
jgi:uncharacterized protein